MQQELFETPVSLYEVVPGNASEKQVAFINKLSVERDLAIEWVSGSLPGTPAFRSTTAKALLSVFREGQEEATPGVDYKRLASQTITALLDAPYKPKAPTQVVDVPEGMHQTPDGAIYKVQVAVHGSGRKYAKKLIQTACTGHLDLYQPSYFDAPATYCNDAACDTRKWKFAFAPGAVAKLSENTKLSMEDAKEFGALYGTCCVCARTLTKEESISQGIGPACGAKI